MGTVVSMRFTMAVLCLAAASAVPAVASVRRPKTQPQQRPVDAAAVWDLQAAVGPDPGQLQQSCGPESGPGGGRAAAGQPAGAAGRGRAGWTPRLQPRQLSLQRQLAGQCGGWCAGRGRWGCGG